MEESARIGMSGFGEALRKDGLRFLAGAAVLLAAGGHLFYSVKYCVLTGIYRERGK